MFNRRRFIAAVGAVLAAPIAVAKGWFEGKPSPVYMIDHPALGMTLGDQIRAYPKEACNCCGQAGAEKYPEIVYQFSETNPQTYYTFLCDPCAEKQGYLCENRSEPTGIHYWMETEGCLCGKRGCPSLKGMDRQPRRLP